LNNTFKAHAAVLGANLFFGINYSVLKVLTTSYMNPFAINMARAAVSTFLLWVLYLLKPSSATFDKKDLPRFILCGATGVTINQLLFVKGVSLTISIHAALLSLATPIFIVVLATWMLKEAFTFKKSIGLALGICGALLLVLSRTKAGSTTGKEVFTGDLFIIINAISYAFYFVIVRPLMQKYSAVHVLRWVFTFGTIMIIPFGFPPLLHTDWQLFEMSTWAALSFAVIGATFLSYLFNIYSLKILGPGITGSYIYTQPLFAAAIGILLLNEPFESVQIIAALLIAAGVFVVNNTKPIKLFTKGSKKQEFL
jgi:drug/metabolite transporter (DMT)-like permease